ncbi:MAG: hypothetical protein IPM83_16640 [Ignavibacteria bacterium]|nr:hypothetical protein [Ignavibacteria bacterium]
MTISEVLRLRRIVHLGMIVAFGAYIESDFSLRFVTISVPIRWVPVLGRSSEHFCDA